MDRHYLPPKAPGLQTDKLPGTDLFVWRYEAGGRPYALMATKKNSAPLWHLAFSSEQARERHIETTVQNRIDEKVRNRIVDRYLRNRKPPL